MELFSFCSCIHIYVSLFIQFHIYKSMPDLPLPNCAKKALNDIGVDSNSVYAKDSVLSNKRLAMHLVLSKI